MGAFIYSYEYDDILRKTKFKKLGNYLSDNANKDYKMACLKYKAAVILNKDNHREKSDYIYYSEKTISYNQILLILDKEYLYSQYISLFNSNIGYEEFLSGIPDKMIVDGVSIYNLPANAFLYVRIDIDGKEEINTHKKTRHIPQITSAIFGGKTVDVYFTKDKVNLRCGISR